MANKSAIVAGRRPAIEEALALHQAGRLAEAERIYQAIIDAAPRHFDALHLLGVVCTQQGRNKEAAALISRALERNPRSFDAHYNLGIALASLGTHQEAIESYRRAIGLNPNHSVVRNNLGVSLQAAGRLEEAIASYWDAIERAPDYAEAHYNLGNTLMMLGRHKEAVESYRHAIAIRPTYAEAHHNLGAAMHGLHQHAEAIDAIKHALSLRSDFVEAWNSLGSILSVVQNFKSAEVVFRRSLAIRSTVGAHIGLGHALRRMGQGRESAASYRAAVEADPTRSEVHSDYIYSLDFIPGLGFQEQQAERRNWYERHGKVFTSHIKPHPNDRDPERKLRLGYVSADFNHYSPALAFGPVLRNHDRSRFDLFLYSGVIVENHVTQSFRELASQWRDMRTLSDEALAKQIRVDRIDILIDLSGHSYGHRLLVFARKPAPVQVTAWGYATATGVPTIDYLFADPVSVPENARSLFAEKIYDLPCIIGHVVPDYAPEVVAPPSTMGNPFTFGCLNSLNKITPGVLDVWSRLLRNVPDSRLLLKDTQLSDAGERQRISEAFVARGVAEERLVLLGHTSHPEHLAAFAQVDIALDPFPTTGGISTMEALWMGVPVVALLGNGIPSRVGAAIVSAAGLRGWVAGTEDEYIAIAAQHAADPAALAELRMNLRPSLKASPLGDSVKYCHSVEAAYRAMWRTYCHS